MAVRPSATSALALALFAACSTPSVGAAPAPGPTTAPAPTVHAGGATTAAAATIAYGSLTGAEPPLSLTTEDGNGLELTALDAKAVIQGPLAFTELHLTFKNPDARIREGRFQITLPTGAAISRFAMQIDGTWTEAEMVERGRARRAYEDFLHRRTDPALLEKQAGNQFQARVFPIPASGTKEIIVSYSQELTSGDAPYLLPLRGLPRIGQVTASARVLRADRGVLAWDETKLNERAWQPDRDFAIAGTGGPEAVAAGGVVAVRLRPELGVGAAPIRSATILFDTSASRALGYGASLDQLDALVAALAARDPATRVTIAAFDQDVAPIFDGKASELGTAAHRALATRQALGASDLGAALAWAAAHGGSDRVIVVTDGVATAGASEAAALGAKVAALKADRLDVVLVGGIRDEAAAKALARGHLAHDGAVLDGSLGTTEVARRLQLGTRSSVAVAIDGATWSWPRTLDGLQPGDAAVVYAALDPTAARAAAVTAVIDGHRVAVVPAAVPAALVTRAAAQAEVAGLEAQLGDTTDARARAALADRIVQISVANRVLSDHTALLVLESDADYARFGLDRRALADILVVGRDGLALAHRAAPAVIAAPDKPTATKGSLDQAKDKNIEDAKRGLTEEKQALAAADTVQQYRIQTVADPEPRDERPAPDAVGGHPGTAGRARGGEDADGDIAEDGVIAREAGTSLAQPITTTGAQGQVAPTTEPMAPPPPRPAPRASDAIATEPQRPRVERAPARIVDRDERRDQPSDDADDNDATAPAWSGDFLAVMQLVQAGRADAALASASAWRARSPGDVLALVALGEVYEAKGDPRAAARAYGSIIDLFPGRADLRRFAGERLERLGDTARDLLLDTYQRAVADRPDHLTGHRLLAFALVRAGRWADAFAALEHGLAQSYPDGRFAGGVRVLTEDLGIVGAAWAAAEPSARAAIVAKLATHGAQLATGSTLRFILYWETDDNDVDFHIHDARGNHAYFRNKELASGGALYEDITTGYGPECFAIDGRAAAGPYHLQAHYYSRGPMGYGMGLLEIMRFDGKKLRFEPRPFIVMNDHAFVELGTVK
jgi:tetratricopeptide (TPR) repeat protein